MKMTKFVSQYRSASDLEKPELIVIDEVGEEEVGNATKPVLYGEDPKQVYVLNPTNIANIIELLGSDDSTDWVGQMIVAYNDKSVMFGGKKVGGIRFRLPKEGTKRPPRPESPKRVGTSTAQGAEEDVPF